MSAGVDTLSSPVDPSLTEKQVSRTEESNVQPSTPLETNRSARKVTERVAEILISAKAEILASGQFLTPYGLAEKLDIDANGLTVWLEQSEVQLQIFSIKHEGQIFYPSYTFSTGGKGNLIPGLQDVLTVLHPKKDGWDMAFWFRSPNTFLGGERPEDLLDRNLENIVSAAQEG
jgi:hypothetical protein